MNKSTNLIVASPTVLDSCDVLPNHCVFNNSSGVVTLYPHPDALVVINSQQHAGPVKLAQGEVFLSAFVMVQQCSKNVTNRRQI